MKNKNEELLKKYKNTGLKYFEPEKIIIPEDPYSKFGFNDEQMEQLRESVDKHGIINPVIIDKEGNCIAGKRRVTVALEKGLLVPGFQFLEDILNEDYQAILHHTNNVVRALSAGDKKKLVIAQYGDIIGSPKSLRMISERTGIHYSTIKKISAAEKKKKEFDKIGKELTEEDYKANLKTFIKLEKVNADLSGIMKKKRELEGILEKRAPLSVWKKWISRWEKEKSKN
ncbi:MAG: ParB N-terminal domain-containing protein [Leptospiraceae bacterium]|nr:ParB N-terminal domain-containing protein [Leptospiraceae bacterium]